MMDLSAMVLQINNPNPNIGIWDIIDFAIAAYLIYVLFKLLRGTIAFNIFIGVILLYVLWWTVRAMNMYILSTILDQFVNIGVIVLVIIFQPEIRRFLLLVGSTTLKSRLDQIEGFIRKQIKGTGEDPAWFERLSHSITNLSRDKKEAVIVVASNLNHESFINSGVKINADLSPELLDCLLDPMSTLSEGAVILSNGTVVTASCVLPAKSAENNHLTASERSALGISEQTSAFAVAISHLDGSIKYALSGELFSVPDTESLMTALKEHLTSTFSI